MRLGSLKTLGQALVLWFLSSRGPKLPKKLGPE